ncbi:hypothetical protein JCM3766R1_001630 [Sporobolomyces carnicolor]
MSEAEPSPVDPRIALLEGALASVSSPITEHTVLALASIVGHDQLRDALDLIDRDHVARVHLPNGRTLYQVASANSSSSYTVHPELDNGGYCPCPAYSRNTLGAKQHQIICKHLLACRIADKLERGWNDKFVSLKWVAGWSTQFGIAVPDSLKQDDAR